VLAIRGRKYVLSTDGGPLGDREDDDSLEDTGDQARLISPPQGANKWRYLWAYDTDKNIVAMWRVSDGNEKVWGSSRQLSSKVLVLDRKGQLNRVAHNEFKAIEAEMTRRADLALDALRDSVERMKDDETRQLDRQVSSYFQKKVLPVLIRKVSDLEQGVVPFNYKARPGTPPEVARQQMVGTIISQTFQQLMTYSDVEGWLAQQGLRQVDSQNLQWAIDDCYDEAWELVGA